MALAGDGQPEELGFDWDLFFSVVCAEDLAWIDARESRLRGAGTFLGDTLARRWGEVCAEWPRGAIAENYREPVRSDVPALVLSVGLDPVTPPRWGGDALAEGFPMPATSPSRASATASPPRVACLS